LIDKKPETLESLLRFLIYIVLHQEKTSSGDPDKITEHTKKTLLELLKSDEKLKDTIFGAQEKPKMKEVQAIEKITALQGLTDKLRAKAIMTRDEMRLDVEANDLLKANRIAIKFISFRTPSSMPPQAAGTDKSTQLPSSLVFMFRFYTFQAITTEVALLKTAEQIEQGNIGKELDEPIRLSTSYYLVYSELMRLFYNKAKPALDKVLERGIQHQFEINPMTTKNPQEHVKLAEYLSN
jgi:hypothetical protein